MHFLISIENVSPSFSPKLTTLKRLIHTIELLYPAHLITVHVEYTVATRFTLDPTTGARYPKETVKVDIYPLTGPLSKSELCRNSVALISAVAGTITTFLAMSDSGANPNKPAQISISAGYGSSKFLDQVPVQDF